MARRNVPTNGIYSVGGDDQGRLLPSLATAISLGQNFACRSDAPRLFGIFRGDAQVALVERKEDGTVITTSSPYPEGSTA